MRSPISVAPPLSAPAGSRGYGRSYEYRSAATIGGWPLVHICAGPDPQTGRPRVAKGVIAIGSVAVGVVAIGGLACGLISAGGCAVGLWLAMGGVALGLGLSTGGLAIGSIAIGGAALGFSYAIGGLAAGPAVISGTACDQAVLDFARRWLGTLSGSPHCG